MNWKDILKNVITQGRVKEIEDVDIDIEDDDCNRKLQRLANKLKNTKLLLEQTWNEGWDEDKYSYHPYVQDMALPFDRDTVLDYEKMNEPEYRGFFIKDKKSDITILSERLFYTYNPVPEEVACKALEMLKLERTDKYEMEVGGRMYEINSFYAEETDGEESFDIESFNSIDIQVDVEKDDGLTIAGNTLVTIEWAASLLDDTRIRFGDLEYLDYARILSEWDKTSEYGLTWHR